MEELKLKHILPYVNHGLVAQAEESINFRNGSFVEGFFTMSLGNLSDMIDQRLLNKVKLCLNPLSDLTVEVEHNGEKFVPLEKLFGMTDVSDYIDFHMDYGGDYTDGVIQVDDEINHVLTFLSGENRMEFYCWDAVSFGILINGHQTETIMNQRELFEKLFEWHFDVFGLIEKGLAIDKNTLK